MLKPDLTDGALSDLALTIINDDKGYDRRVMLAKQELLPTSRATHARLAAIGWQSVVNDGAREHAAHFGTAFTVLELLTCALELREYYAQHVKELEIEG